MPHYEGTVEIVVRNEIFLHIQKLMAEVFRINISAISKHLKIYLRKN